MLPVNWDDLTDAQKAHLQKWSPGLWASYCAIAAQT